MEKLNVEVMVQLDGEVSHCNTLFFSPMAEQSMMLLFKKLFVELQCTNFIKADPNPQGSLR